MEKQVRIYSSFEEADNADAAFAAALSPQERLQILIDLRNERHPDAAEQAIEKVVRISSLKDKL